jgi:hypothetical protein
VIDAARVTAAAMTGEDGVGGGGAPERGGVSVVNLMGRHAGFLAAHATLAARDVDACLVPEVPFFLEVRGRPFVVCFRFVFVFEPPVNLKRHHHNPAAHHQNPAATAGLWWFLNKRIVAAELWWCLFRLMGGSCHCISSRARFAHLSPLFLVHNASSLLRSRPLRRRCFVVAASRRLSCRARRRSRQRRFRAAAVARLAARAGSASRRPASPRTG